MISSRLRSWFLYTALVVVALGSPMVMHAQTAAPAAQAEPQQF